MLKPAALPSSRPTALDFHRYIFSGLHLRRISSVTFENPAAKVLINPGEVVRSRLVWHVRGLPLVCDGLTAAIGEKLLGREFRHRVASSRRPANLQRGNAALVASPYRCLC